MSAEFEESSASEFSEEIIDFSKIFDKMQSSTDIKAFSTPIFSEVLNNEI